MVAELQEPEDEGQPSPIEKGFMGWKLVKDCLFLTQKLILWKPTSRFEILELGTLRSEEKKAGEVAIVFLVKINTFWVCGGGLRLIGIELLEGRKRFLVGICVVRFYTFI